MKNSRHIIAFVSLLVLLISITWTQDARADESNRKTFFTINQPVRVPGNIILPPGKYAQTGPAGFEFELNQSRAAARHLLRGPDAVSRPSVFTIACKFVVQPAGKFLSRSLDGGSSGTFGCRSPL